MATRDQLIQALQAADAAGNTEDAAVIAAAIKGMSSTDMLKSDPPLSRQQSMQSEFDALPWYNKALTAADDTLRLASEGVSFGYGDKLAALLYSAAGGGSYEDELAARRQKLEDAKTRSGTAGIAAEVGGALINPIFGATGSLASGIIPATAGLPTRMGLRGLTGAAEGGIQGALSAGGHDKDVREGAKEGALFGAMAGPIGEMLASTGGKLLGAFDDVRPARSVDDMREAKNVAYRNVDNVGAVYSPITTGAMVHRTQRDLNAAKISPTRHAAATSTMDEMVQPVGGNPQTLTQMEQLRQVIERDKGDAANTFMSDIMKRNVDDVIENTPQGGMLSGDSVAAGSAVRAARDANRRYSAMDKVAGDTGAIEKGGRMGKDGVEQLRAILNNPAQRRGFTPDEIAKMEEIVHPGIGRKAAGVLGKLGGGTGIGIGSTGAGIAYSLGSIPMAAASLALPVVGATSRTIGSSIDKKKIKELLELIDGQAGRTKNVARRAVEGSGGLLSRAATAAHIQGRNNR